MKVFRIMSYRFVNKFIAPSKYETAIHIMQEEYMLAKPARDAAAKAKMEAEVLSTEEVPLHDDNEWNIRCLMTLFLFICM